MSEDDERERTGAGMTAQSASIQGLSSQDPRREDERPPRITMGQGQSLDMSGYNLDRETFYYHLFAEHPEKPGRITEALSSYYEAETDANGTAITVPTGNGTFHLMKLLWKYRNEDLALKRKKVLATMDKETQVGVDEYAPDAQGRREGGTSALSRDVNPHA